MPLDHEKIPKTYPRGLPLLTESDVSKILRTCKKSKSKVKGDINADLYGIYSDELAVPITHIFNGITRQKKWPLLWKREYVTVIPKGMNPETPADCRNIFCTNFLSKVYERIVMGWAREEVKPKLNQYGGESQASATHLLMEVLHYTTSALEDNRNAVVLSAVDFSRGG